MKIEQGKEYRLDFTMKSGSVVTIPIKFPAYYQISDKRPELTVEEFQNEIDKMNDFFEEYLINSMENIFKNPKESGFWKWVDEDNGMQMINLSEVAAFAFYEHKAI